MTTSRGGLSPKSTHQVCSVPSQLWLLWSFLVLAPGDNLKRGVVTTWQAEVVARAPKGQHSGGGHLVVAFGGCGRWCGVVRWRW